MWQLVGLLGASHQLPGPGVQLPLSPGRFERQSAWVEVYSPQPVCSQWLAFPEQALLQLPQVVLQVDPLV